MSGGYILAGTNYKYKVTKLNNFFNSTNDNQPAILGLKGQKLKINHFTSEDILGDKTPRGSTCNCVRNIISPQNPDIVDDVIGDASAPSSRTGSATPRTPRTTRRCLTAGNTLSKAFRKKNWDRYESRRYGRKSAPTAREEEVGTTDFFSRSLTPQPISTFLKDWVPVTGTVVREEIAHIHMGPNSPRNTTSKTVETDQNSVNSKLRAGSPSVNNNTAAEFNNQMTDSTMSDNTISSKNSVKVHRKEIKNSVTFSNEAKSEVSSPKELFQNSFKRQHRSKGKKQQSSRQRDGSKKSKKKTEEELKSKNEEEATGGEHQ